MHKEPKDWDICTSALPEQVIDVFENYKIIPTGLKHGTVTIIINDEQYEITTYRIDGEYEDNRHPKEVKFTTSLEQDLSRRDFTINAMAYNPQTGLIDIFGGRKDIEGQIIRCVGDAEKRFEEDALRILRAMRFAIRYNFIIDLDTIAAMNKCRFLLSKISEERINSELTQMLACDGGSIYFTFGYTSDILTVIVPELRYIMSEYWMFRLKEPNELNTRLTLFFDFYNPENILKRMRFDNKTMSSVCNIRKYGQAVFWSQDIFENVSHYAKWLLNKVGYDDAISAVQYARTYTNTAEIGEKYDDYINSLYESIQRAYFNKECYMLSSLKVNGTDAINAGFKGKSIGSVLNRLLNLVMSGMMDNDRDKLLKKLDEYGTEMQEM